MPLTVVQHNIQRGAKEVSFDVTTKEGKENLAQLIYDRQVQGSSITLHVDANDYRVKSYHAPTNEFTLWRRHFRKDEPRVFKIAASNNWRMTVIGQIAGG